MTEKEKQLIVNALLFTGCVDVINNFGEETQKEMINIAIKMGADPTDEIEIFGEIFEQPEIAKEIINSFAIKHTK